MSRPGQPHISQAIRGEVVEVGQGGQVQEDHLGQVIYLHRIELAIDDVREGIKKSIFLGKSPKLWVGWGQES